MLLCDFFSAHHSVLEYFIRIIIDGLKLRKQKAFPYAKSAVVFPALGLDLYESFGHFHLVHKKPLSAYGNQLLVWIWGTTVLPTDLPNPRAMGQTSNSVDFLSARLRVKLLLTVLFLV